MQSAAGSWLHVPRGDLPPPPQHQTGTCPCAPLRREGSLPTGSNAAGAALARGTGFGWAAPNGASHEGFQAFAINLKPSQLWKRRPPSLPPTCSPFTLAPVGCLPSAPAEPCVFPRRRSDALPRVSVSVQKAIPDGRPALLPRLPRPASGADKQAPGRAETAGFTAR